MKLRGPGLPTAPSPAPSSSLTLAAIAAGASSWRRAGGEGVLGMEVLEVLSGDLPLVLLPVAAAVAAGLVMSAWNMPLWFVDI